MTQSSEFQNGPTEVGLSLTFTMLLRCTRLTGAWKSGIVGRSPVSNASSFVKRSTWVSVLSCAMTCLNLKETAGPLRPVTSLVTAPNAAAPGSVPLWVATLQGQAVPDV